MPINKGIFFPDLQRPPLWTEKLEVRSFWETSVTSIRHWWGRQMNRFFEPSFTYRHSVAVCVCVCARIRVCRCDLRKGRKSNRGSWLWLRHIDPVPLHCTAQQSLLVHTCSRTHKPSPHWPNRLTYEWRGQFLSLSSPLLIYGHWSTLGWIYTHSSRSCAPSLHTHTHTHGLLCWVYNTVHWHMRLAVSAQLVRRK